MRVTLVCGAAPPKTQKQRKSVPNAAATQWPRSQPAPNTLASSNGNALFAAGTGMNMDMDMHQARSYQHCQSLAEGMIRDTIGNGDARGTAPRQLRMHACTPTLRDKHPNALATPKPCSCPCGWQGQAGAEKQTRPAAWWEVRWLC